MLSNYETMGGFFAKWDEEKIAAPDLIDVLSDLDFEGWNVENPVYQKEPETDFQKLMRKDNNKDDNGRELLTDHQFSNHTKSVVERFKYMLENKITKKSDLPLRMQTRKFNQKPLPARWDINPTMTVTSLPDDYIHYSNPRTFSVREWARMQTFPDKHIFSGPRTTGGHRRAGNPSLGNWSRDVPKYTQIGNAVPPLLGKGIGQRVRGIICGISPEVSEAGSFFDVKSLSEHDLANYVSLPLQQKEILQSIFASEEFTSLREIVVEYTQDELSDQKKASFARRSLKRQMC